MVTAIRPVAPPGTSLKSLVNGFVLTKQTEGKSPRTVEFYSENLKRFLWYGSRQGWSDDIRMLTEWHIREFLSYVANERYRWGLTGNGAEACKEKASYTTMHHYFVVLANFLGWVIREGFLADNPISKIKVAKPKAKVIKPYTYEEISRMLAVCDHDYEHNAKFLGSRNKAIVLVLLDAGVRLSELLGMTLEDVNTSNGNIRVMGKGNKERVVRIGKVAQKALWRYLMHRPNSGLANIWLSEKNDHLANEPVKDFILAQPDGAIAEILHVFKLLREFNIKLGMPYVRKIGKSGLRELRIKHSSDLYRIFYFAYVGRKLVLLHAFLKKEAK